MMAIIVEFAGKTPRVASTAFIADNAVLVGDVEIGDDSSIWFGAVLRADFAPIRIGRMCNIQDNVVAHADSSDLGLTVEDNVTVGHSAIVHGVRIKRGCLIGMGAILLSGSDIGANTFVAAGSVVREGDRLPPNSLAAGNPAVVKRALDGNAARWVATASDEYARLARQYRSGGLRLGERPR
jgi:carbonic anhydrase/acetyltransferase-like protein (isoleucine patch superfamily)